MAGARFGAAADRLVVRELFDGYAHCADRRDAEGQKASFKVGTRMSVFMNGQGGEPRCVVDGREAMTPVFADLNQYVAKTRFSRQSTIESAVRAPLSSSERATGESYAIAHPLSTMRASGRS